MSAGVVVIDALSTDPASRSLAFTAIQQGDDAVLQGAITALAILIVSPDIIYALVDPRVRIH